ncbi:ABC transporter permease [Acinetobacter sp. B5B]|uniref:ABC transporter permease n=1 Tax=Acinetobacter baretiae TaxID=2605383 RepID=UPI0018C2FD7E|nr:ABC transporter permease [Acinetobacter baretiae]MBF7682679.1 ABC transporter permease [Acinetobacter baretiae]MBF7684913.1 ABC transporter permease [Acinetobacter baretiae]
MKSFVFHFLHTFKEIKRFSAVFTTLVLGSILYGFFYPTAYKAQQAEDLPIIIVDQEHSVLTQQIIHTIRSNPNIHITQVTSNFLEAQQYVQAQKADAILLLPEHLSSDLLANPKNTGVGLYISSAYLIRVKQIASGLATSLENVIQDHVERFSQISHFRPELPIHQIPLFNTLSGYGSYIFPAVAPLIIHQTILLGVGMLVAGYREKNVWKPKPSEFFGFFTAILTIGCLACFYLFGFIFWLYDYPRGGNFVGMLIAVPIFVSCIIGLSMFIATFFDMPERVGHVLVPLSIVFFLLSGTSWPLQSMPLPLQWLSLCLPSTHAIQMFVQLNQMGVPTSIVIPKLIFLSVSGIVFILLAHRRLQR